MRSLACIVPFLLLAGACGQGVDHPKAAPGCDPTSMKCVYMSPPASSGTGTGTGNQAGASSSGEELTSLTGQVVVLGDDAFSQGTLLSSTALVTAIGEGGARVMGNYDGMSFKLEGVLKDEANWFLVTPEAKSGMVPTITPVDTSTATGVSVGVANALVLDSIFLNLNTERSLDRAQVVLRVVDAGGKSVVGVHATASETPEVLAYRTAGTWLRDNSGMDLATDDSGMILFGNLQVGTALASLLATLSGAAAARVDLEIVAGATTLVTVVVAAK